MENNHLVPFQAAANKRNKEALANLASLAVRNPEAIIYLTVEDLVEALSTFTPLTQQQTTPSHQLQHPTIDLTLPFLSEEQAQSILHCSYSTLNRRVNEGEITRYRNGGSNAYRTEEVLAIFKPDQTPKQFQNKQS